MEEFLFSKKEKWKRRERVQLEIELNVAAHSWSCSEGAQKLTCVFLEVPWPSTASYGTGAPSLCFVAPQPIPA